MATFNTRLLKLLIVLAIGIVIGIGWVNQNENIRLALPILPDPNPAYPAPTPTEVGCVQDPAFTPAPPAGPDGRSSNYLHTCQNRIYDSQRRAVDIVGVNWSGMETGDFAPGGLGVRKWTDVLDQVVSLGYNTIRLPYSNELLKPDRNVGGVNFGLNPDLQGLSGMEVLDRLIAGARQRGLRIILDHHRPTPWNAPALWYGNEVSEDRWIADWRALAVRYKGEDTVIGFDLHNEPRNPATWGSGNPANDWRLAAERAGDAILQVNPYLLIFVEGIEDYNGDHYWWGGNLAGVSTAPVRLIVPNRIVYSPHDYGPGISDQAWFHDAGYPTNLATKWDQTWGYIQEQGIAPIVVGEFGGHSVGNDREGQWQRALVDYLRQRRIGALVWSLNPTWDTGGILADDWRTVRADKQQLYDELIGASRETGSSEGR